MPVASLPEVMDRAFSKRYGVAAFNTVDDITMHGVIRAAEQSRSPLIVQISVKTVKFWGAEVVQRHVHGHGGARHGAGGAAPGSLSGSRGRPEVPGRRLELRPVRRLGHELRGEPEADQGDRRLREHARARPSKARSSAVAGVEDGMGSDEEGGLPPIEKELEFIADTGIYCYAPPIGTAHGFYKAEPKIRYDRMEYLVKKTNMPMVLHGGTGLNDEVYGKADRAWRRQGQHLDGAQEDLRRRVQHYLEKNPTQYDPLKLIGAVQNDVTAMAQHFFKLFGSEGQA